MNLPRVARTLVQLHPLQVLARPIALGGRALGRGSTAALAPALRSGFAPPRAPFVAFADAERRRGRARLAAIPEGSLLHAYESAYGYELGADPTAPAPGVWEGPVASHPFPASVRARRLAVAARLGRPGLSAELARACRAVALGLELHLMANHLLENAIGLVCGGAVARGLEAEAWWRLGSRLLSWQLPEQFLSDGGHFELSASYHLSVTAGLLEAIELSLAAGREVPELWRDTARNALAWAAAVRAPDGTYPLFNDAALDAAPEIDGVLALGAALGLLDAGAAPGSTENTPTENTPTENAPTENTPPADQPALLHLPATGWVILRFGERAWLAFDAGMDGAAYQPGHVHADALTFELWVEGERAVVDHGVSSYIADPAREETRATRAHNTVELGGADSSEVWSAFRVGRRARAQVRRFERAPAHLVVEAEHDGYRFLPGAPVHRRELALSERELAVHDEIVGGRTGVCSRLRLDEAALQRRSITVDGVQLAPEQSSGVWYPCFRQPRAAVVFSGRGEARDGWRGGFRLRW
ncbi:heparinase II/III domain-containing protein [Sorangium sp. So ce1151]|uniref:heparinase II/III domain-containing protein n=1 Tax=Sorangium sp. So ce1151 TaxID=3133332 RepID=UPI003F6090A6